MGGGVIGISAGVLLVAFSRPLARACAWGRGIARIREDEPVIYSVTVGFYRLFFLLGGVALAAYGLMRVVVLSR